jgi:PelA/Pel-15E family pectate lyase
MLKFLMTLPQPDPELVSCVSSALEWLETSKIVGISRVKHEGKTQYEPNPGSTEVYWARFYSLSDGKPIFPGRDGVIYQSYSEMAARNKIGYDFYSTRPGSTVGSSQKKWRKMLASAK